MDKVTILKDLSDEELAADTAAGSRSSFEELISRYSPRLFYFLRHRTASDQNVEDLIQETFLKAFRNIDRFDPKRKFSTWLYTIAARQAVSLYRVDKAKRPSLLPIASSHDPQEIIMRKQESQNLWKLARKLSRKEYKALWLYYAEDMPVKNIAEIMKKKKVTVRVLLHRARTKLAKKMDKSVYSESFAGKNPAEHKFSFSEIGEI